MNSPDPRYPIGRFAAPTAFDLPAAERHTASIRELPTLLRLVVSGLGAEQLDTPYRLGGWTVRQTVHHIADSHLNAYQRTRLAVTEDEPRVLPYDEAAWAELPDARQSPVEWSLALLDGMHARWATLLTSLDAEKWRRRMIHPQHAAPLPLWSVAALYAWHGSHHVAHIRTLRDREGW